MTMKLRLVDCHGGGRDNPHSYPVSGDEPGRCSLCHDVDTTAEENGWLISRNVWGKQVDRKRVWVEPQRSAPDIYTSYIYSPPGMFGS